MKKLFPLVFALALFVPFSAHADVIMEGHHPVLSCYEIENLAEFNDYTVLLLASDPLPGTVKMGVGSCATFYKFSNGTFLAVRNDEFKSLLGDNEVFANGEVWEMDDTGGHGAGSWGAVHRSEMIESGVVLEPYEPQQVPDSNPLVRVDQMYRVERIDDDGMRVAQSGVRYSYDDGTTEEHVVDAEMSAPPEPTRDGRPHWAWLVGLPAAGIVGLMALRGFVKL